VVCGAWRHGGDESFLWLQAIAERSPIDDQTTRQHPASALEDSSALAVDTSLGICDAASASPPPPFASDCRSLRRFGQIIDHVSQLVTFSEHVPATSGNRHNKRAPLLVRGFDLPPPLGVTAKGRDIWRNDLCKLRNGRIPIVANLGAY